LFVEQETPRITLPCTSRKIIPGEKVITQTTATTTTTTTTTTIIIIIIIIIITKFTRVDYSIKCVSYKLHLKYNILTPWLHFFFHIYILECYYN